MAVLIPDNEGDFVTLMSPDSPTTRFPIRNSSSVVMPAPDEPMGADEKEPEMELRMMREPAGAGFSIRASVEEVLVVSSVEMQSAAKIRLHDAKCMNDAA